MSVATGFGSGQAFINTSGNTVTADVHLAIGQPNTPYNVRLIQGPRPGTQTCNAGEPGVAFAVLNTDGNGTGAVTLHDTVRVRCDQRLGVHRGAAGCRPDPRRVLHLGTSHQPEVAATRSH